MDWSNKSGMAPSNLRYEAGTKTVTDLVLLYENDQLNLSPGFQRESVWKERDRSKLIESILRGYPIPAIFLYRRQEDGQIINDVIDGKQRIEAILMFMGNMRGSYRVRTQLPGEDKTDWVNWKYIKKRKTPSLFVHG